MPSKTDCAVLEKAVLTSVFAITCRYHLVTLCTISASHSDLYYFPYLDSPKFCWVKGNNRLMLVLWINNCTRKKRKSEITAVIVVILFSNVPLLLKLTWSSFLNVGICNSAYQAIAATICDVAIGSLHTRFLNWFSYHLHLPHKTYTPVWIRAHVNCWNLNMHCQKLKYVCLI